MATNGCSERERPVQLLRDVVISRVLPSSVSEHPRFLYPSVFDMMVFDKYTATLLLYRIDSTDPSALTNFIHALKNSLSRVLSLYYPMAGKWIPAEDAWTRKLACNDEGAVFVEAAIDNELDNVLHRDDFNPPEELLGEHAVPGFEPSSTYKTSETNEYPALIVQVTRFKCGGVALTLNYHHMTVDGFGFDRFLKAWSEILSTGQTSEKPVFDRSLVASHLDKSHILGISSVTVRIRNSDQSRRRQRKFSGSQPGIVGDSGARSTFGCARKFVTKKTRTISGAREKHIAMQQQPHNFTSRSLISDFEPSVV